MAIGSLDLGVVGWIRFDLFKEIGRSSRCLTRPCLHTYELDHGSCKISFFSVENQDKSFIFGVVFLLGLGCLSVM
jgi:hypothetical protein